MTYTKIPVEELPDLEATAKQMALLLGWFEQEVMQWRSFGPCENDGVETIGFFVSERFNLNTFINVLNICQQAVEARAK